MRNLGNKAGITGGADGRPAFPRGAATYWRPHPVSQHRHLSWQYEHEKAELYREMDDKGRFAQNDTICAG